MQDGGHEVMHPVLSLTLTTLPLEPISTSSITTFYFIPFASSLSDPPRNGGLSLQI